ncbi:hypothetical protein Leryth_017200 [Lithospermum erythrorhizon]|nr:hypothetical protein Leryth_017200 [Lithospermum erythrorhizon]
MAASAAMQSILACPLAARGTTKRGFSHFLPSSYVVVPCQTRKTNNVFRVRSMSEDQEKSGVEDVTNPLTQPINPTPTPAPKPKTPKPKTGFSDIFAFSGPGPERINGRLAMIGFVAAIGVELASGQGLLAQVSNGGIPLFLGTSALLTAASLVPLFKGVSVESKSDGLMTSDAEIWNGRFAMLGLIALAFTEYVKGSALV